MSVGGNIHAILQVKGKGARNSIGAFETEWCDCADLLGWLDLSAGDSKRTIYNAKVQESTHIFLCDFRNMQGLSRGWLWNPFNFSNGIIKSTDEQGTVDVTSENARLVIQGLVYEILLIDNPMQMNEHLEIYLRFIGGQ